jgi:probable rRNA maturation factor
MPTRRTSSAKNNRKKRHAGAKLELSLQLATASTGLPPLEHFRRWARAPLLENADVTLRLVGQAEGRALNCAYRRRDYATNVLTFVYPDQQPLTGDIVLCLPVIKKEARLQGKTLEAHLAHLTVHGVLHLQGFDHESDDDAELMEGIETEIVSKLGYPDPYAQLPE